MSELENSTSAVQNKLGYKRPKKRRKTAKPKQVLDGFTQLYRHFDRDDRLLYVGISLSAVGRQRLHRSLAPWYREISTIKIEAFPNRWDAQIAEYLAIKNERPLHNSPNWRGNYFSIADIASFKGRYASVDSPSCGNAPVIGVTLSS